MSVIGQVRKAFEQIRDTLPTIVLDAVQSNEDAVIDLVTEDQLSGKGITVSGTPITPAYTPFTTSIKRRKGQETGHVTLKDTGAFHKSIFIKYESDSFSIVAKDSKTPKIIKKYGDDILGLTEQNKGKVSELIEPDIIETMDKIILEHVKQSE